MARSTTTKRKLASGLTWRGNTIWIDTFVDGERLRQSCKTNSPAEARKLLDTVKGQRRWAALTGKVPEHLQTKVPLQGFVDDVLREMEVDRFAPRTLARYRYIMRVFVAFCQDELGREPQLKDITDDLLRSYKLHAASTPRTRNGNKEGTKRLPCDRTVCNELDCIRVFTRKAVDRGLLRVSPKVDRIKGAYDGKLRWLTQEESDRLRHAAETWDEWHGGHKEMGPILRHVIDPYLRTGMRSQELRHLCLGDIKDYEGHRYLRVEAKTIQSHVVVRCEREDAENLIVGKNTKANGWPPELVGQETEEARWQDGYLIMPIKVAWRPKTQERNVPVSGSCLETLEAVLNWRTQLLAGPRSECQLRRDLGLGDPSWLIPDVSGLPWR